MQLYVFSVSRAVIVEKLCEYLSYKSHYENAPAKEDIPAFAERIIPEIALELCVGPKVLPRLEINS